MRIGMITQWYEPETGAAAHPTAIARALADRGHDVKVLTGFPSYPHGRLYEGWTMQRRMVETRDGIRIVRVPDVPSHDDNPLRRALSLTSFATSAKANVGWLWDVDVCLTYLTPATVGAAARRLRRVWGVPYVLWVQDLWPETVTSSGFIKGRMTGQLAERGINRFLRGVYSGADSIVGLSPAMCATLAERAPGSRTEVVYNWVDEDVFGPADPSGELPADKRWLMYAGGIGQVQALDSAVRAIGLLSARRDIGLALVGDGVAVRQLRDLSVQLDVGDRVRFLGHRPMEGMPGLMSDAVAQVISLRDLPLFRGTVPSKLQASMAARQPVVCGVAGEAAELTRRSGAGIVVPPENPPAFADAFQAMVDMDAAARGQMAERSRRFYLSEMSAQVGGDRLERLLVEAAERRWRVEREHR